MSLVRQRSRRGVLTFPPLAHPPALCPGFPRWSSARQQIPGLPPLCTRWSRRGAAHSLPGAGALAPLAHPGRGRTPPRSPSSAEVLRSLGGGDVSPPAPNAGRALRLSVARPRPSTGKHPKKGQKRKFRVKLAHWGRPPSPLGEVGRRAGAGERERAAKVGGADRARRGREHRVPGGSGGGESALASRAAASWKICGARGGRGGRERRTWLWAPRLGEDRH